MGVYGFILQNRSPFRSEKSYGGAFKIRTFQTGLNKCPTQSILFEPFVSLESQPQLSLPAINSPNLNIEVIHKFLSIPLKLRPFLLKINSKLLKSIKVVLPVATRLKMIWINTKLIITHMSYERRIFALILII